jgi:hypothetical protein
MSHQLQIYLKQTYQLNQDTKDLQIQPHLDIKLRNIYAKTYMLKR